MPEIRVRAHWAREIYPFNPLHWLTRTAVYDVTCGNCLTPFVGKLHYMIGTPLAQIPVGWGVRCLHCGAFNELTSAGQ